jgi:Tfp pilus assembly protein PilV
MQWRPFGFTMAEVMMATTILGVGFIGMIEGLTIGSEELDTTRKQQVAAQIVSAEIERLRSGQWSTIANLPTSGSIAISSTGAISGDPLYFALSNYTTDGSDDNLALSRLGKGLTCSYTCTRLRPGMATATTVTFVRIVYTVSWTSNTGRTYSRSTETYLGKNGLHLSYQKS